MSWIRSLTAGLRSLLRKEQVDQDLDEELTGFLEMATEEKITRGMSREDARREVRLEMGSPDVAKEIVREAGWESLVETSWQDLRFAARSRWFRSASLYPYAARDAEDQPRSARELEFRH